MNKRIGLLVAVFVLGVSWAFASVVIKSDLNKGTGWGDTKQLKSAPREIVIGQFNLNFMTTRVAGASAGSGISKASVAVRAELDLTEADAQSITDGAFPYLKQQLVAKGYTLKVHDPATLKAAKNFEKYAKKDKEVAVVAGLSLRVTNKDKVDERIASFANGVATANLGAGGGQGYIPLAMEMAGKPGQIVLSVVGTVDFTEAAKKASSASMLDDYNRVSVAFKPMLRLIDDPKFGQTALNYYSEKAIGGKTYGGNVAIYDASDWINSNGMGAEAWRHTINPEGYKRAVEALLKSYIDQLVLRVEDAKATGK